LSTVHYQLSIDDIAAASHGHGVRADHPKYLSKNDVVGWTSESVHLGFDVYAIEKIPTFCPQTGNTKTQNRITF
jgi:hypothetical protein